MHLLLSSVTEKVKIDPRALLLQSLVSNLARELASDPHLVRTKVAYESDATVFKLSVSASDLGEKLAPDSEAVRAIKRIVETNGTKLHRTFLLRMEKVSGPQLVPPRFVSVD